MNRALFLVLALLVGLNAGLLYVSLSRRGDTGDRPGARPERREGPESPRRDGEPRQEGPGSPESVESIIRGHLNRLTKDLGLDQRQRDAIAAVHERLLPRITDERRRMDALRREVTASYASPRMDAAEFRELVRRVSSAQVRIDSLVTEAMLGEAAVLTAAQRERYVRLAPWGHPMAPPDRSADTPRPPKPGPPRPEEGEPPPGPPEGRP